MNVSTYVIDTLRTDGEFVLGRGRDPCAWNAASILALAPVLEHPAPELLQRLEHEYALGAELDAAWAVRPILLTRHQGRSTLIFEDPGGEPLNRLLGVPIELGRFLRIAVGISAALRQLHGRGLIHKDIKPANVLVDPDTGRARLMGFGIASRLRREAQPPESPEFIAGTLPYMAPEQTGRMNRSIDSRSDLYALGVTLYEMSTGTLPFLAADPMEWVHCHIARRPLPPEERRKDIPSSISAIIMKLLAKMAEERYQTAAGVEADLRRCLAEWEGQGRIDRFPLGEHDTPDRLLIPEKLYGRQREIDLLLVSFDRIVRTGATELVLVSGYSGIGKSSVINDLHRVLVPPRGQFTSGKCDQYRRDIPYSTVVQAFRSLVRPLLGKTDTELSGWRDALVDALGPNGRLMVDVIPELKLIIGDQPPVPELPPPDAQRRFQLVCRRFVGVFARPEHPLVLFLDDLQWLDAATLDVLEDLLTRSDVQYLMLIGAYRDNEVDATHPLMRKLDAIKTAGGKVVEITLGPLAPEQLGQLIADAVRCPSEQAAPLTQLVQDKTGGNPFFAIQFMSSLAEEQMLAFDHDAGRWAWDLGRIHAKGYTDNVVDLMVEKLTRLPAETLAALRQLACLGDAAEITTLSIVLETPDEQVHATLWPAVRQELLERRAGAYVFVHDRVRETAYSLIPEAGRDEEHLRIGQRLAAHIPREKREEAIFEIVNQLNRGTALITSRDDREQLAELNLIAGKRAKASTAYASALNYLAAGEALLAEDGAERCPGLGFALALHRAECEFLSGDVAVADARLSLLSERATTVVDLAAVTCLRVEVYTTRAQFNQAVNVCLAYLRSLGIDWSPHPSDRQVRQAFEQMWRQIGSRPIEALIDLPLMTEPDRHATMDVLARFLSPALFTDNHLFALALVTMVNLSLEHGNCDASCLAYAQLIMVLGPHFGDYPAGFRFGQVGCDLVERRGLSRFEARVYLVFGHHVMAWARHLGIGRAFMRRAFDAAQEAGDLTFATYSATLLITNLLASGAPLDEVQREAERGLAFATQARFPLVVDCFMAQLSLIRSLRSPEPDVIADAAAGPDEGWLDRHLTDDARLNTWWYWIRKLQARFYAGDHAAAVQAATKVQAIPWTTSTFFEVAEYHFYGGLARAASHDTASADERRRHLKALVADRERLATWAQHCPENFENRAALVGAEIARIEGRALDAERLYEDAIRSARANGFVHNEALAYELAAGFYAARGFDDFAALYLRNARHAYRRWGAEAKVWQLDRLHPHLREEESSPGARRTIGAAIEQLELATVLNVSRAVSGELVLERLVETLLRTAIEHAGAERGLLVLPRAGALWIQAEANTDGGSVVVRLREAPVSAAEVAELVVQYAARTQESVILDDASVRNSFSDDEYIRQHRARSILCLPLVKQGALVAVLYMENNLVPNVFTPARIAVLRLLASEAAMSLDNSRLYRELQEREAKIRRLVEANIIGVVITDFDGPIIEANAAFLDMVGYSRDDLIGDGLPWTMIAPPEWHDATERAMADIRATGRCATYEKEFVRKDGSRVWALVGGAAFEETRRLCVAFVLDLSDRRRAEEALQKAQAELAHVTRVTTLGELAASIAHEVNQPLGAIVADAGASLNWLAGAPPDLQRVRESLEAIVKDAHRAADVIQRMRQLAVKSEPRREPVDVNGVIRDVVALVRAELRHQHAVITLGLTADLSPVFGDRVQLQQVILNLVMNALEGMVPVSGRPREIAIRSELRDEHEVCVTVQDTGVGIDPEHLDRLFDAFFTTKPGGMGMGLWISRSIVEAHGGQLWATSNTSPGAIFQFSLPIDDGASGRRGGPNPTKVG